MMFRSTVTLLSLVFFVVPPLAARPNEEPALNFWRSRTPQIAQSRLAYHAAITRASHHDTPEVRRTSQALRFAELTLAPILNRLSSHSPFDLGAVIAPRPHEVLAQILSILSASPRARELIEKVWPVLSSQSMRAELKIVDELDSHTGLGRCTHYLTADDNKEVEIQILGGIPLGLAALVYAHELLHLHDTTVLNLSANDFATTVYLEQRAYRFEQLVTEDLFNLSSTMREWMNLNPALTAGIRNMNRQTFAKQLKRYHGVPLAKGLKAFWGEVSLSPL